jgi:hypothetical protein
MSYALYCYKSQLGSPNLEEAQAIIEVEEDDYEIQSNPERRLEIVKALVDYNPRLECFDFDFNLISMLQNTDMDKARDTFEYSELNTKEGDLVTQITIDEHCVTITVPYWYSGKMAKEVFDMVISYTKILRQKFGYFVYDPQIESVYDPLKDDFEGLEIYQSMVIKNEKTDYADDDIKIKKTWWKFW